MRKTWKERQVSKCIKTGNQYRWLKPIMLLCIVFIVAVDRTRIYFMNNRKRLIGTGVSFLIFLVSNSFSTPAFQNQPVEILNEINTVGTEEEMETAEELLFEEDMASNLEAEVLEDGTDKYSVDEILKNSTSQEVLSGNNENQTDKKLSKDDWNLLLVNKQHPVPKDYSFELGTIAGSMQCDARILPELFAMLQAARDEGIYLAVCSPYRDIERQQKLFERKIKTHMGNGYSYLEAYKKASQIVTIPGASEHQIGLALDIISNDYTVLNAGFENTAAGKWLKKHCKEYGFILRYPRGKEDITGIDYEPWHFRYVGKEAAAIIMENELTLEEFVEGISE